MPSTPLMAPKPRDKASADVSDPLEFDVTGRAPIAPPRARIGILESALRHWVSVLACVALFVGLAAGYALTRPAVYTATSRLSVSAGNPSDPAALPGVVQASQALAAAYSRTVDGAAVTSRAADRLGTTPTEVAAHVSATPVPESSLITLKATGPSARAAVATAGATGDALIAHVASTEALAAKRDRTLRQFRLAALQASQRQAEQVAARRDYLADPTSQTRARLNAATANTDAAVLRREGLRLQYQDAQQSAASGPSVEVLERASSASSDRLERAQLMILGGLAAGLIVGLALATFRANRPPRRVGPR